MNGVMTTLVKSLPQTVVGLAFLAMITVLGYTGHMTPTDTVTAIWALIGLVGSTGLFVLASQLSNSNAVPHLIVGVAMMAAIVTLGLHDVLHSAQLENFLALLLTGTAGGGVAAGVTLLRQPSQVPSLPLGPPSETGHVAS